MHTAQTSNTYARYIGNTRIASASKKSSSYLTQYAIILTLILNNTASISYKDMMQVKSMASILVGL